MVDSKALIQATLGAGVEFFRPPGRNSGAAKSAAPAAGKTATDKAAAHKTPACGLDLAPLATLAHFSPAATPPSTHAEPQHRRALVPMRALSERHRERIAQHLIALEPHDRYLRFGLAASDAQIRSYTDKLDFARDEIYGIYNRKLELIAMAHLAFAADASCNNCAEFGVSVLAQARGRGYGSRLFDRAVMHARNEGVDMLFIHALSENTAMLKIARNAGATVQRDGSESDAYLKLPPATLDTRMTEAVEDHFAEIDFQLKLQAKKFWAFLASVQEVRHGVRGGRHQAAE